MAIQNYTFKWEGIEIEITYDPTAWGGATAQLKIRSVEPLNAPLPMTETGFISHYHPVGTIEHNYDGDVVASVTHWLNEAAKSKEWQAYLTKRQQLDLFD